MNLHTLAAILENNWNGEAVEALSVDAIARVEHPSYPIEWYLLAINPQNEMCTAIMHHRTPQHLEIVHIYIDDLINAFNMQGLEFQIDRSFKRQNARRLWNKIKRS